MKKSIDIRIKILLVLCLIAVILCGIFFSLYTPQKQSFNNLVQLGEKDSLLVEKHSNEQILLTSYEVEPQASGLGANQRLTATVLPENASNKLVDWTVSWVNTSNTTTVTDYVYVRPDSDGSCSVYVYCKQQFEGDIKITVTTREGGFSAFCLVRFEGVPDDVWLYSISDGAGDFDELNQTTISRSVNKYQICLVNGFDLIHSKYNDFSVEVEGFGSINVADVNKSYGTTLPGTEKVIPLSSLNDKFVSYELTGNVLTIYYNARIEDYYESIKTSGHTDSSTSYTYYTNKFLSYNTTEYGFKFNVYENQSGVSKTFWVHLSPNRYEETASVTVDKDVLVF